MTLASVIEQTVTGLGYDLVEIERSAGGLLRVTIDPSVVSKDDVPMLQDLMVAAVNDAHRKIDDAMKQKMGGLLGGLRLPGL